MVEQHTISITLTSRLRLLVFIHTLKLGAMMSASLCHDISIILPGPGWRAAGLGWDHNYSWSRGHIAHSTRHIVIMNSLDRPLKLCSMNRGMSSRSISVCEGPAVFRVLGHAQVISSTS